MDVFRALRNRQADLGARFTPFPKRIGFIPPSKLVRQWTRHQGNLIIPSLLQTLLSEWDRNHGFDRPAQRSHKIRHLRGNGFPERYVAAVLHCVQSVLQRRIENRPRSHHAIRRRMQLAFFAGISSSGGYPTFFTEWLVDARDTCLTIEAPAPTHLSTATASGWEQHIQPAPAPSVEAIRPGYVVHGSRKCLDDYNDPIIWITAGVKMIIIMDGKTNNARGMIILIGALCASSSARWRRFTRI